MNIDYKALLPYSSACEHRNVEFFLPGTTPKDGEQFAVTVNCLERGCGATTTQTLTFKK